MLLTNYHLLLDFYFYLHKNNSLNLNVNYSIPARPLSTPTDSNVFSSTYVFAAALSATQLNNKPTGYWREINEWVLKVQPPPVLQPRKEQTVIRFPTRFLFVPRRFEFVQTVN